MPTDKPPSLPADLRRRIERSGYYPELVLDTLEVAVADEQVRGHLVHAETTFDTDTVRRHITVLVLTSSRLIHLHADDHGTEPVLLDGADPDVAEHAEFPHALVTTDAVDLAAVRSVSLTHVVPDPQRYVRGRLGREITVAIGWGGMSRLDLEPATCGDPQCEADHGYTGSVFGDDLALRITADAEGGDAVSEAVTFARLLSATTAGR